MSKRPRMATRLNSTKQPEMQLLWRSVAGCLASARPLWASLSIQWLEKAGNILFGLENTASQCHFVLTCRAQASLQQLLLPQCQALHQVERLGTISSLLSLVKAEVFPFIGVHPHHCLQWEKHDELNSRNERIARYINEAMHQCRTFPRLNSKVLQLSKSFSLPSNHHHALQGWIQKTKKSAQKYAKGTYAAELPQGKQNQTHNKRSKKGLVCVALSVRQYTCTSLRIACTKDAEKLVIWNQVEPGECRTLCVQIVLRWHAGGNF